MKVSILLFVVTLIMPTNGAQQPIYGYEDDAQNLIQNGGFEEDLGSEWVVEKGKTQYMTDAHTGVRSVKVYDRTNRFGGVKQRVYNVAKNSMYYASAFIKTLNSSQTSMYFKMRIWVGHQEVNQGLYSRTHIGRVENQRASGRWKQLGGDFITPDLNLEYTEVFLELVDQSLEYLVDSVSLIPIPSDPDWKATADAAIQEHRTAMLDISGQIPSSIPYCHCEIRVNLTRRDFGLGSAIQSDRFNEETEFGDTYRNFHVKHFNWAVFGNSMKWSPMEPEQGNPKVERVQQAMDFLELYNQTVRGHSVLWGAEANNPEYVQTTAGEDLREEVYRRVDYLVSTFKGRVREWDVINEWLHGNYYDVTIGDHLIQDEVYNRTRSIDPDVDLFTNDFQIVRTGDFTSAVVDQVQELEHRGVPVGGIGIQSHLTVPVPVELLRKRLEIATASGFPVSITELNVYEFDIQARAAKLEEALRVYFSNPGVRCILFWFVSDQERVWHDPDETALFEGPEFTPNVAGQVLLDLLSEWQTHLSITPKAHNITEQARAYHGAYNVETLYKGQSVKNQTFHLSPGPTNLPVVLNLAASDFPAVDPADGNCV